MKKNDLLISVCVLFALFTSYVGYAQNNTIGDYSRSSIYTIAMLHPGTKMYDNIHLAYWNLPSPEKYNNHDLSLKVIFAPTDKIDEEEMIPIINNFLLNNQIAKRMVSKWFNRDKQDGSFNMSLIQERGNYNATQEDLANAMQTKRGKAMLSDAGEQLIHNTFIIVNDIAYVDKEENAQKALAIFSMMGQVAGAAGGSVGDLVKSIADLGGSISNTIAGFTVDINSYLFQLSWNDEVANSFYQQYYFDKSALNSDKKQQYESDTSLFHLTFVGSYSTRTSKTVTRGLRKPEDVFKKVLSRAIDNNIVELQKQFSVFKVTVPLFAVKDNQVLAHIGLKEGVSPDSKYEVLERIEDAEGNISYKRVGIIKPVKDQIWDNRYMAIEESAKNATLTSTTFDIVSGKNFYPGMLIREIKFTSGN